MKKFNSLFVLPNQLYLFTYVLIGFGSFVVPFLLGHPQLVVGTIVNASLYVAVLFLPTSLLFPILIFPSLAVISRGLLFGSFTHFLLLLAPFIWLGNWILINVFKKTFIKTRQYWLAVVLASIFKFSCLFLSAYFLVSFHFLPKIFLTTMGSYQLITALIGGGLSWLIQLNFKN